MRAAIKVLLVILLFANCVSQDVANIPKYRYSGEGYLIGVGIWMTYSGASFPVLFWDTDADGVDDCRCVYNDSAFSLEQVRFYRSQHRIVKAKFKIRHGYCTEIYWRGFTWAKLSK